MSIQVESTTWPMNISEPGMLPRQGCVSGRRGYGRPPWPRVPEAACGVSEGACMSDGGSGWRGLACGTKVGAGTRGMAAGGSRAWAWPWLGRPGGGVARARCGCPLSPHPLCYLLDLLLQCPTGAAVRRVRRSKRAERSRPRFFARSDDPPRTDYMFRPDGRKVIVSRMCTVFICACLTTRHVSPQGIDLAR